MLRIPYCVGMFGLSSVLSLKHAILPAYSLANSSITGAIILHGPHHGAQNSTSTGLSLPITKLFHVESVTTLTAPFHHYQMQIMNRNHMCSIILFTLPSSTASRALQIKRDLREFPVVDLRVVYDTFDVNPLKLGATIFVIEENGWIHWGLVISTVLTRKQPSRAMLLLTPLCCNSWTLKNAVQWIYLQVDIIRRLWGAEKAGIHVDVFYLLKT